MDEQESKVRSLITLARGVIIYQSAANAQHEIFGVKAWFNFLMSGLQNPSL